MSAPDVTPQLVAELGKKTGVCWLRYGAPGAPARPAWHIWLDTGDGGALYVVSGGAEQRLPGLELASRVAVTMRSKDNGGRLLTWMADASRVQPGDERWDPVTAALVVGRLNLADPAAAADAWAVSSVVTRLAPTGEVLEGPDDLPTDDHRTIPAQTTATTRGPLPRVLHRRVRRRPRLS